MDKLRYLTITFAHGVEAQLLDLKQYSTYWGILAGGPIRVLNEGILAECTRSESMVPVHLVHPTEIWVEGDHLNLAKGPAQAPGRRASHRRRRRRRL